MMEEYPQLKQDLFIRGFLITDEKIDDLSGFPFYGNWKRETIGNYRKLAFPGPQSHQLPYPSR